MVDRNEAEPVAGPVGDVGWRDVEESQRGPPDEVPKDDPYAALEGRKGAQLWVVSTKDGSRLAAYDLKSPPVFDGMIAADGRLYIATTDGQIICMSAGKEHGDDR